MKRIIIIYSLILGAVISAIMVHTATLCYTNPEFQGNDIVGYAAMIIVFSIIFFGVRNYRNKLNNGEINFWPAFKMGVLIAFIGSTIYVVTWLFYFYLFIPDFLDKFIPHVLLQASRDGATAAELTDKTKEMDEFREMYKSPFFVILTTYFEVFPVGAIVALISAFVLRRRNKNENSTPEISGS